MSDHHKFVDTTTGSWFRTNRASVYVAALVITIGITYWIIHPFGIKHLARKNYVAPFAQMQPSNPAPEDSLYHQGMAAFSKKNWEQAISAFSQIEESYPFYERSLFYQAHAWVGEGEYEKALQLFKNPIFLQGQYTQQVEWNKVLMLMLTEHPQDEILVEVNKLAYDPHHFYADKAREILKKLPEKKE